MSGWGPTEPHKGPNSELLQLIMVRTFYCEDDEKSPYNNDTLCAVALESPSGGFCMSDMGGPLIISPGLIGIASWHQTPCGYSPVSSNFNSII